MLSFVSAGLASGTDSMANEVKNLWNKNVHHRVDKLSPDSSNPQPRILCLLCHCMLVIDNNLAVNSVIYPRTITPA